MTGALSGAEVHRLRVRGGGVATSGIHERLWRREDGTLRPPPARPRRPASRPGPAWSPRPRPRPERARGRGARQDRAALRPARRAARAAPRRRRAPARGRPRRGIVARPGRAAAAARRRGRTDPLDYAWWLASRSAGIVAYLLLSAAVLLGLAMALRLGSPRLRRAAARAARPARARRDRRPRPARDATPGLRRLLVRSRRTTGWTGSGVAAYLARLSLTYYARPAARRWGPLLGAAASARSVASAGALGTAGRGGPLLWPWGGGMRHGDAGGLLLSTSHRYRAGGRPPPHPAPLTSARRPRPDELTRRAPPDSGSPSQPAVRPQSTRSVRTTTESAHDAPAARERSRGPRERRAGNASSSSWSRSPRPRAGRGTRRPPRRSRRAPSARHRDHASGGAALGRPVEAADDLLGGRGLSVTPSACVGDRGDERREVGRAAHAALRRGPGRGTRAPSAAGRRRR